MTPMMHVIGNLAKSFNKIGTANGTARPQSDDNRFGLAFEYYIADRLASIAGKRKEQAKAACKSAGLLGDEDTFKPGNTVQVYDNEHLTINAKTANPANRIDPTELQNVLIRELGEVKALKLIMAATKQNKAAVTYEFAIK